jgi:hypothetical protein
MQNDRLKNYFHLHLIVFIWGFTAILGKLISIEALPLVWYRMFLASFSFWCFYAIQAAKYNRQYENFNEHTGRWGYFSFALGDLF